MTDSNPDALAAVVKELRDAATKGRVVRKAGYLGLDLPEVRHVSVDVAKLLALLDAVERLQGEVDRVTKRVGFEDVDAFESLLDACEAAGIIGNEQYVDGVKRIAAERDVHLAAQKRAEEERDAARAELAEAKKTIAKARDVIDDIQVAASDEPGVTVRDVADWLSFIIAYEAIKAADAIERGEWEAKP